MNGTVLDILLYVFDRYMFDEAPEVPEREALARHLASAGFGEANVERALDWHRLSPWYEVLWGQGPGGPAYVESGLRGAVERLDLAST